MITESLREKSKEGSLQDSKAKKLPWQLGVLKKLPAEYIAVFGSLLISIGLYILCSVLGKGELSGYGIFLTLFLFFVLVQLAYIHGFMDSRPVKLILYGLAMLGALSFDILLVRNLSIYMDSEYDICYVIFILTFVVGFFCLLKIPPRTKSNKTSKPVKRKKKKSKVRFFLHRLSAYPWASIIKSVCIGTLVLVAAFLIIEECSGTDIRNVQGENWWYNFFFFIVATGLAYILIFRIRASFTVMLVFVLVAGLANGYVIEFRGSPILPADLYLIDTAMEVSGGYNYAPTNEMCIGISFFFIALMLVWAMKEPVMSHKKRLIGRGIFAVPFAIFMVIGLLGFKTEVDANLYMLNLWQPVNTYKRYGSAYGFGMNFIALQVQKPTGYSTEEVQNVLEGYTSDEKTKGQQPNVIVVLCEGFSDLSVIGDFKTNEDYLPNYRSLSKNVIKGYAYSSVLGGTTADSEYELLTGNAITYLPAGTVPYQQYIHEDTLNFTRTLKSLGYYATALHPYSRNTYRREIVYPLLGFDEYQDMTFIDSPNYLRYYITDETDFNKVIDLYENRDTSQPFYLYNVTMQNHSPYDLGKMEYNIDVLDGDYPQADEYLSCISATDASIPILLDYFSKVEEPTYILFVGDHQPNLYDGFFEYLFGCEQSELDTEQLQKRYTVPFFIWSNQDIEEKQVDAISMNYLSSYFLKEIGFPLTAYNKYLLDLYEKYPVVNINGYLDTDQVWHNAVEMKQNKELNYYNMLVYNGVVNNNKDVEWAYQLK